MTASEPKAPKRPQAVTRHGHTRMDDYAWLRDDERQNPDVLAHLAKENAWFRHCMSPSEPLQDRLYDEMTGRLDPDDSGVPYEKNGYWYQYRHEAGLEYALHVRRRGSLQAPEEIVLDENQRAEGQAYYRLGHLEVSDDHRYVAIAEDTVGRGRFEIRILDTASGHFLPEVITNASSSLAWSA